MAEQRLVEIVTDDKPTPADKTASKGEIQLPQDYRSFMLTGIFVLMTFYTMYVAREIMLPVFLALVLKLLLQPVMRVLSKLRVPTVIASLLVMTAFIAGIAGITVIVAPSAARWLAQAPYALPRLEEHLTVVKNAFEQVQEATQQVEKIAQGPETEATPVKVKGPGLADYLFSSTRALLTGFVMTMILLFFLLLAGDVFLRRLVEILPTWKDKKQAVDISNEVERNISAYLLTITMMNAAVGVATGIAVQLCGLPDPVLWGVVAFLLNYIPILGPLTGIVLFFLVGMLSFDSAWQAVLLAAIYLVIHLIEGEGVTPMILARRFTLNPVLVVGSLVFWHWMWGIPGAFLAVPMLAIAKIVCDRIGPLMAVGHFLGG
jgi:predicted PurR-regulated permease PerM